MTPHNEALKSDISKIVLMPGDPLRAKYIADNFLKNVKLVNTVRNMFGYTGKYKGKEITVFASGMGMPSIGIYSYELFKFYDVDEIIRIGSAGAYKKDLKLFDIVLTEVSYNEGMFAYTFNNLDCHSISANTVLNKKIEETAKNMNIPITCGNTLCTEVFEPYMTDVSAFKRRIPFHLNFVNSEMESFALLYTAHTLRKKASCLTTISDAGNKKMTPEEREKGFTTMIKLALNAI